MVYAKGLAFADRLQRLLAQPLGLLLLRLALCVQDEKEDQAEKHEG